MTDELRDVPPGTRIPTRKDRSYSFWKRKKYNSVHFVRVYESFSDRKGRIIS
jgi:hypothetical protein